MRHVVFLVGRYYPMYSAPGECAAKLINEIRHDCKVTVVAIQTHGFGSQKEMIHEGVAITYVSNWRNDLRVLVTDWKDKKYYRRAALLEPLVRILNAIAAMFLFPTRDAWYKNMGYRALKRVHRRSPVDVLVSVSFPFCTHWAAWRFSRKFPKTKWVTYSVDTLFNNPGVLTYSAYKAIKPLLNRLLEKKILSAAGHNFVTPEIASGCPTLFSMVSAKTTILNYMMPHLHRREQRSGYFSLDKCNLLYGGAFYHSIRTPEYLLKVFERVTRKDIVLHMFVRAGDCTDMIAAYKNRIGERLQIHEIVEPREFKRFMQEADILINLENNLAGFLPSKVFEYFATGKPLISFKYREQPCSPMIERYPCLLQIENFGDDQRDARAIEDFCLAHKGQQIDEAAIYACYPEHTPKNVAAEFRSVLLPDG